MKIYSEYVNAILFSGIEKCIDWNTASVLSEIMRDMI